MGTSLRERGKAFQASAAKFDEEAEIELTGSQLEEEANMAEIEEDGSTDFINALCMNDSYGF